MNSMSCEALPSLALTQLEMHVSPPSNSAAGLRGRAQRISISACVLAVSAIAAAHPNAAGCGPSCQNPARWM